MLLMALGNLWHAEHYNVSQMDASHTSLANVYEIDGFQVQNKYALFIQICQLVFTDLTDKTLIICTFLTFSVYYTVIMLAIWSPATNFLYLCSSITKFYIVQLGTGYLPDHILWKLLLSACLQMSSIQSPVLFQCRVSL